MTDLFTADGTPAPQAAPAAAPVAQTVDQLLAGITNAEGKQKYDSVEKALEGTVAAQQHIAKLEAEADKLREAAVAAKGVDDILSAIQAKGQPDPAPAAPAPVSAPELDTDKIDAYLNTREQEKIEAANSKTVTDKLTALYGEKASETFYSKASEIGMDKAAINTLAKTNPKAVYKLLGITDTNTPLPAKPVPMSTGSYQAEGTIVPGKGVNGTKAEKAAEWAECKRLALEKFN